MRRPSSGGRTLYYGTFVHSVSISELEICEKGAIGVDGYGKIVFVEKNVESVEQVLGRYPQWAQGGKVVKAVEGSFFFPGFIDTHIHAPQFPIAGIFGSKTLLEWLDTYTFPTEASFKDLKRAKTVYERVVTRTLSHGTTTASYYATIHVPATNLLSATCFEKGQRALIGRMCMDCNSPEYYKDTSVTQAITDTQCTIDYVKQIDPKYSLIRPIITPRFAIACSRNMMSELGKLAAKEDLQIQTHISENEQEIDYVRNLFPECTSYADVYDCYGVLGPRTILGHAVHLSKEELALVKLRRTKLSHCPVSNAGLGSGIARVRDMLDAGVDVGLGSDVSGGYSPSILEASRHALLASRLLAQREKEEDLQRRLKLQVEEVLYLGTLGGAKVVGLEGRIGNFVVGKEWDALLVQLHSVKGEEEGKDQGLVELFDWQTKWEDKLAKWVYCGDDRNNLKVWVRGRLVYERKEMKRKNGYIGLHSLLLLLFLPFFLWYK